MLACTRTRLQVLTHRKVQEVAARPPVEPLPPYARPNAALLLKQSQTKLGHDTDDDLTLRRAAHRTVGTHERSLQVPPPPVPTA